ncbi:MAG: phage holin family protein [Propionicimonas sp.]
MLVRFLASAAALAVATFVVGGITVVDRDLETEVVTILAVAVIFGVVNTIVKPLFRFVTAPLVFLSLGLFLLVINALLLMFTSWVAEELNLGWHVDGWWPAFWGGLIVSIVSFVLNTFFGKRGTEHR